jgi:hypothetical protein
VVAAAVASVVDLAARRSSEAAQAQAEAGTLGALARNVLSGRSRVSDVLDQARETFGQRAASLLVRDGTKWSVEMTVTVGEIRFTSNTEAALYFELNYTGGALFGQQVGYAKLIDGTWKISRDTMSMVAGWGGGMCDGGRQSGSSPGAPPAAPLTTIPNN